MARSFGKVELRSWAQLAKQGHFHVAEVAIQLGISSRGLELHFKKRFHKSPHKLFAQWRAEYIQEEAKSGQHGKEIFEPAGLSSCSSLTRALMHDTGSGLRELQKTPLGGFRIMDKRKH